MVLHLQRFRVITANQIVEILIGASPLPGSMVSPAVTIEATKSFNRGTIVFKAATPRYLLLSDCRVRRNPKKTLRESHVCLYR